MLNDIVFYAVATCALTIFVHHDPLACFIGTVAFIKTLEILNED